MLLYKILTNLGGIHIDDLAPDPNKIFRKLRVKQIRHDHIQLEVLILIRIPLDHTKWDPILLMQ
jgi:hypothetical protein